MFFSSLKWSDPDFETFQVCLIERKTSKKVFAMKYINKEACVKQNAVKNVIAEVEMLREVDHPFVVSLWYTFQVSFPLHLTPYVTN